MLTPHYHWNTHKSPPTHISLPPPIYYIHNKHSRIPTQQPTAYYWPMQHNHQHNNPPMQDSHNITFHNTSHLQLNAHRQHHSQHMFLILPHNLLNTLNSSHTLSQNHTQKHSTNVPPTWSLYSSSMETSQPRATSKAYVQLPKLLPTSPESILHQRHYKP